MVDHAECDECRNILEELRDAFAETRASPKLRKQLRDDATLLLRIGEEEGADEAIEIIWVSFAAPAAKVPKDRWCISESNATQRLVPVITHLATWPCNAR